MPRQEALAFYINPHADSKAIKLAKRIHYSVPGSFMTQELKDLKETRGSIIACGGDGTGNRVVDFLFETEDFDRQLGVLPGGTNNAGWKNLAKAGATVCLDDFLNQGLEGERYLFRPGMYGSDPFVITVGVGEYEQSVGRMMERLRNRSPRDFKRYAAFISGIVPAVFRKGQHLPPLNLVSTSPSFGAGTFFPKQEMHSSLLTHAYIEGEGAKASRNLFITLVCWGFGAQPPKHALRIEQVDSVELSNPGPTFMVDGETIMRKNHRNITVTRAEQAIAIAAII